MNNDVIIRVEGKAGRITLNRPDSLNALTYEMILEIERALIVWRNDQSLELVIIDATGERAFCAGGDIQYMYDSSLKGDFEFGRRFWRDEYRLNALIANYPKPYVAFMDGIVMGGGVGVSAHGSHRLVTSRTMLAMPECAIGLVPDVGGSYLLANAPGHIGEYMAATGARLNGSDAIFAGFGDTLIDENRQHALSKELAISGNLEIISDYEISSDKNLLSESSEQINTFFSTTNATECIKLLENSESAWAASHRKLIRRGCPLSIECAWEMMVQVRNFNRLEQALALEYRFTSRSMSHGDFLEGTRAMIIDKDRNPKWAIERLEEVTAADVSSMLESLGNGELSFE